MPSRPEPVAQAMAIEPDASTRADDPRSLRSQDALRSALLRLIETRPLAIITLRDITAEAGVSYPTFFKHFDTKERLFEDLAQREISDFLINGFRSGIVSADWRPGESICRYIDTRRSLWRTLLTAGASGAMRTEFIRLGREMPRRGVEPSSAFPIDVISGVIASGIFEIIAWWLGEDPDHPMENIANMLEWLVIEPALSLPVGYYASQKV